MKWMFMSDLKDEKLTIVMNNKEYLKNVYKILLEGLVTEDQIKGFEEAIKIVGEEKHLMVAPIVVIFSLYFSGRRSW